MAISKMNGSGLAKTIRGSWEEGSHAWQGPGGVLPSPSVVVKEQGFVR